MRVAGLVARLDPSVVSPLVSVATAVHAAAAVLLVVAGAAKLSRRSDGFAGLLGWSAPTGLVRLLGCAEVVAGASALWVGGPAAASAVGLLYTAFALAVLRGLLMGAGSCGCFGRFDAPPSPIHVLGNLVLAAGSFAATGAGSAPVPAIADLVSTDPVAGVTLAVEIAVLAGLALVAFTALPEALGARNSRNPGSGMFRAVPTAASRHAASSGSGGRR